MENTKKINEMSESDMDATLKQLNDDIINGLVRNAGWASNLLMFTSGREEFSFTCSYDERYNTTVKIQLTEIHEGE